MCSITARCTSSGSGRPRRARCSPSWWRATPRPCRRRAGRRTRPPAARRPHSRDRSVTRDGGAGRRRRCPRSRARQSRVTLLVPALRGGGERNDAPPHAEIGLAPAARSPRAAGPGRTRSSPRRRPAAPPWRCAPSRGRERSGCRWTAFRLAQRGPYPTHDVTTTIVVTRRRFIKRSRIEGGAGLCYKPRFTPPMSVPDTIAAVKGFRDVLPDESRRWRAFEEAAERLFTRYGFGEIRLPVVERTELFARSLGETTDIVEKEMYSFADRDETGLTLRPEATAGVVRAYLESGLAQSDPSARLFYRGPMFRRERPQRGRYRQFYQIGAEVLGRDDPLADAELLVMLDRYLAGVGARATRLELNSVGDRVCRPVYRERLREFGRAHLAGLCPDCHRRLERNPLRMLDCKVESCQEIMARAPVVADSLCEGCRAHLAEVRALLEQERVAYAMNPRLVRGLDYYCRTAFEVVAEGLGAQNAVGGGGRYDGLVAALGGPDIAGVGFALGLERLAMAAPEAEAEAPGPAALILPLAARAEGAALALATRLRDSGLAVGLEPAGRSLKAMLRTADRRRARLAVILGEEELEAGRATVRDLVRHQDRRQVLPLDASGPEAVRSLQAMIGGGE